MFNPTLQPTNQTLTVKKTPVRSSRQTKDHDHLRTFPEQNPVLTFEGKRYDLNTLPDEMKELVRGMQVADAQLRMHEDTLKVLAVGRQSMAMQLNERLKDVTPLPDEG